MSLSKSIKDSIYMKYRGRCAYCGCCIEKEPENYWDKNAYCIDHIYPKVKGGSNKKENLNPSCRKCNAVKSKHTIEKFREIIVCKENGITPLTDEQKLFIANLTGYDIYKSFTLYLFYYERGL